METDQFSVNVLRCPFGVRAVQFVSDVKGTPSAAVFSFGDHYARVSSAAEANSAASRSYAVGGTRGIQQLVATTRGGTVTVESAPMGRTNRKNASSSLLEASCGPQADVFSMHDKGRLLLWNSRTGVLVASHAFHPDFTVHQCVVTSACVYTTLEGSPAATGAEEETCVYAWDRYTLEPVTVLRGHEGRLTALAVGPSTAENANTTEAILATASLDGTVRLWKHRYDATQRGAAGADGKSNTAGLVQILAVLPAAELGVIHGLSFIVADVLAVACSKCALAFGCLSWMTGNNGLGSGVTWQQVRSSVDPVGSTTSLHVCAINTPESPQTDSNNNGATTATANACPTPLANSARRRINIVTGSTSGYLQEWILNISEGNATPPPSPTPQEDASPASPTTAASLTNVVVRGRWHHKAHAATVDCIVTDDDIAVSTSIFDGARLYHRKAGATCVITMVSVVPVLVPQLKQLIWGSVDGSVSVGSYALFASGEERELQLLWTAKPHVAAIRGVCLSLTSDLKWKALCVGAADGSVSVWQPATPATPPGDAVKHNTTIAPVLSSVLDTCVETTPQTVSRDAAAAIMTVVGLMKIAEGYALAVAELHAANDMNNSVKVLPLPASKKADDVTCARLCCGEETGHKLCLFAGTRSGKLAQYVREAAPHGHWRVLGPCKWTAIEGNRHASISAISPLRTVPSHGTVIAVVSQNNVDTFLATQRIRISIFRTQLENGVLEVEEAPYWEESVDVPKPKHGSLLSDELNINDDQPRMSVTWMATGDTASNTDTAASVGNGLVVRDSFGLLLRCRWGSNHGSVTKNRDGAQTWATPEVLFKPSSTLERDFTGVMPTVDSTNAEFVVTENGEADILCVNVASNRKRILMNATTRQSSIGGRICDLGATIVRFAGVCVNNDASASLTVVALYDEKGREQYRVNRNGAVTPSVLTLAANPKKEVTFTPAPTKAASGGTSSKPPAPAACSLLAATAADRLLFIGYDDGLLQVVDTTDMSVFLRVWVKDEMAAPHAIREVRYARGVLLAFLANGCLRAFVVPPRSILDQPLPL